MSFRRRLGARCGEEAGVAGTAGAASAVAAPAAAISTCGRALGFGASSGLALRLRPIFQYHGSS